LLCAAPEGATQAVLDQVSLDQRELTTLMIEALDTELSRLLVSPNRAVGRSWYDVNESGTTDDVDYALVNDYLGIECQYE
jgi:hypothetical protein